MNKISYLFPILALPLLLALTASPGHAEDTWYELPVKSALDSRLAAEKLHPEIKLYMKGQSHPAVERNIGEYKTNKRSNAFWKNKEVACETAFISALISLQERAISEGGNGVVDIYSLTNYRRYESADNYNCLAGNMIANVVLMGTVVKLE